MHSMTRVDSRVYAGNKFGYSNPIIDATHRYGREYST